MDLTGQKYGRLTVLGRVWRLNSNNTFWLCRCDCGNLRIVSVQNLRSGNSQSCGCLQKELTANRETVHGMKHTRLYNIWINIRQRCQNSNNPAFKNYGGRGIHMCDEWQQFKPFYEWAMTNGYSEELEIDRINNNGCYSPDNCRWVTRETQANNTRKNHYVTYKGETHTISEWSEIIGISKQTLCSRINNWSIERALTTPVQRGSNGKGK